MNDTTRRRFLSMAGAGVAAAGAAAVLPASAASSADSTPSAASVDGAATGPYVAYVENLRSGRVSVMVGDQEISVVDHDLAARIVRLSRSGA